jgi:hypothetical protein
VTGVDRCIRAGRFDPADPVDLATELWSAAHGTVALHLAKLLTSEQTQATLTSTAMNLIRAYGDDPRATRRSFERASGRAAQP